MMDRDKSKAKAITVRLPDEQALYEAFTRAGADEDSNVDYAFEAQSECVLGVERGE